MFSPRSDVLLLPEEVRIIGGTKFKFEEEDLTFSTILEEIIIHENFSRSSLENNIAIGYVSHQMFMLIMKKSDSTSTYNIRVEC